MAIAPIERIPDPLGSLDAACVALAACARDGDGSSCVVSGRQAIQFIVDVERASRIVDHLQVLAARLAEEHHLSANDQAGVGISLPARAGQAACDGVPPQLWSGVAPLDVVSSGTASSGAALSDTASREVMADGTIPPASQTTPSSAAGGRGFRNCAEFLRSTLGISRGEAKRRLALAEVVLPRISSNGAVIPPRLETLGTAMSSDLVSGRAATIVVQAMQRVGSSATPQQAASMEHHLTRQAVESDEDILRVLARRWEGVLDQDGQEPTDKVLRARQGVFLKGRRHGLHVLEIGATDEQFEHLATVMNSTANPRTRSSQADTAATSEAHPAGHRNGDGAPGGKDAAARCGADAGAFTDPRGATRAQSLLEGLVAACRIALTTAALPATGGHRPQVMVTIDYKDLIGKTRRPGHAVLTPQLSARTIRQLACDADIIPLILGGKGQVLDIGRAQRLFPPHLRRALVARDKGCAFPDCSIPASWCEAHHITPWSRNGTTSISNGVLLCSRHHHLIHQGEWTVEPRRGIPWFHAPGHPGRPGNPRRNRYWQAGQSVHEELAGQSAPHVADPDY